jgi:putative chitinase
MFPYTIPMLLRLMPRSKGVIVAWAGPLEQAMVAFDIVTPERGGMFLANVAHESRELTELEENFNYRTPARLHAVFPRFFVDEDAAAKYIELGPEAIANRVYANRYGNGSEESGEGWRFRGRGPLGLTFKDNYLRCSKKICGDEATLVDNPELVTDPEFGAASAAWYWDTAGCSTSADANDFDGVCDRINFGKKTVAMGDSNGFADRLHYFREAMKV